MDRDINQFKKIVKASSYAGVADIVIANVTDPDQIEDLISLYEMQKATGTYDQGEFQDLLMEVSDPLGKVWNRSGGSQGPFPAQKVDTETRVQDEIGKLIGEIQNKPEKKKKISPNKLLGDKPKEKSSAISPDKLIPKGEGEEDGDAVTKKQRTKRFTAGAVDQLAVNMNIIARELNAINLLLLKQLKQQESLANKLAQQNVRDRRSGEEAKSENIAKKISTKIVDTIKKPFTGFFDRVVKFLSALVTGTAIVTFVKWLQDPENQQKMENFVNFVIDTIPIILAGIAGLVAIGIGSKLIGILGGIGGSIGSLIKMLGPLGLKGALIAIGGILAALVIDKGVKEGIPYLKDLLFGTHRMGVTKGGLAFTRKDVQNIYDDWKVMNKDRRGTPEYNEQAKQYRDLLGSFDAKKGMEDNLNEQKRRLRDAKDQIARLELQPQSEGRDRKIRQQQKKADTASSNIATLENNITFALKQIAERVSVIGLEPQLESRVSKRGGDLTPMMMPGVTTDLETSSANPFVGLGEERGDPLSGASSSYMMPSSPTFNINAAEGGTQGFGAQADNMPKINYSTSTAGVGPDSDFSKSKEFNANKITQSTPSMFSGKKNMIYDIPTPKPFNETIVLPKIGGSVSAPGGSASVPAQNLPPSFSAFDPMNPTLATVLSIYNAIG